MTETEKEEKKEEKREKEEKKKKKERNIAMRIVLLKSERRAQHYYVFFKICSHFNFLTAHCLPHPPPPPPPQPPRPQLPPPPPIMFGPPELIFSVVSRSGFILLCLFTSRLQRQPLSLPHHHLRMIWDDTRLPLELQ